MYKLQFLLFLAFLGKYIFCPIIIRSSPVIQYFREINKPFAIYSIVFKAMNIDWIMYVNGGQLNFRSLLYLACRSKSISGSTRKGIYWSLTLTFLKNRVQLLEEWIMISTGPCAFFQLLTSTEFTPWLVIYHFRPHFESPTEVERCVCVL